MESRVSVPLVLLLSVALAACGTAGSTTDDSESAVSGNRINVEALATPTSGMSAYDIVNQYRPQWLQKRGTNSLNHPVPIKVYLDGSGSAYGSVESLRSIQASQIATIQHFDGTEAQFRFGLNNVSGAILITTKVGP